MKPSPQSDVVLTRASSMCVYLAYLQSWHFDGKKIALWLSPWLHCKYITIGYSSACLVLVLGRPEGKDGEFEARLDHMVSLRLVWAVTKTASKQDMISL